MNPYPLPPIFSMVSALKILFLHRLRPFVESVLSCWVLSFFLLLFSVCFFFSFTCRWFPVHGQRSIILRIHFVTVVVQSSSRRKTYVCFCWTNVQFATFLPVSLGILSRVPWHLCGYNAIVNGAKDGNGSGAPCCGISRPLVSKREISMPRTHAPRPGIRHWIGWNPSHYNAFLRGWGGMGSRAFAEKGSSWRALEKKMTRWRRREMDALRAHWYLQWTEYVQKADRPPLIAVCLSDLGLVCNR